jgi:hypothetical protein
MTFFLNSRFYGSIKNFGFNPRQRIYLVNVGRGPYLLNLQYLKIYLARTSGILKAYYLTSFGEKRRLN